MPCLIWQYADMQNMQKDAMFDMAIPHLPV